MTNNPFLPVILVIFPVAAVFALLWLRCIGPLAQYLQDNHLKIYTQLGSPVVRLFKTYPAGHPGGNKRKFYIGTDGIGMRTHYSAGELASLWRLIGFIVSGRFAKLRDKELTQRAGRARFYFFGNLILFIILFGLMIANGIANKNRLMALQENTKNSPEQIAYGLYKTGSYKEALQAFDKLLHPGSVDRDLWLFRGLTHEKMNNYNAALSDMLHVTKLDPDYFLAYQHVDWLYAREGRWQDIVELWDKYLIRHPYSGRHFLSGPVHINIREICRRRVLI